MVDFLIYIIVLIASVFILAIGIRYGFRGALTFDKPQKSTNFSGFNIWFRLPGTIGMIPEYFYAIILGYENYYNPKWWPLRISSYLSVFLFLATLKSRSLVIDYFSFNLINTKGIGILFTGGTFIWFLNILTVLYLILFTIIVLESIKINPEKAILRVFSYIFLCIMMANISLITVSLIFIISIIYLIIKVIWFLFFNSSRKRKNTNEEESAFDILGKGFREFKSDLRQWESDNKSSFFAFKTLKFKSKPKKKKVRIKRVVSSNNNDEIPRLHPDN